MSKGSPEELPKASGCNMSGLTDIEQLRVLSKRVRITSAWGGESTVGERSRHSLRIDW